MTLPEEKQAAALRELVDAMDALRQAEQDVARATVKAKSVDVSVNRMAEVSGMSRTKIYAVLKSAPPAESTPPRIPRHRDLSGPMIPPRHTGP
jgi:hypothetical protein